MPNVTLVKTLKDNEVTEWKIVIDCQDENQLMDIAGEIKGTIGLVKPGVERLPTKMKKDETGFPLRGEFEIKPALDDATVELIKGRLQDNTKYQITFQVENVAKDESVKLLVNTFKFHPQDKGSNTAATAYGFLIPTKDRSKVSLGVFKGPMKVEDKGMKLTIDLEKDPAAIPFKEDIIEFVKGLLTDRSSEYIKFVKDDISPNQNPNKPSIKFEVTNQAAFDEQLVIMESLVTMKIKQLKAQAAAPSSAPPTPSA